MSGEIQVSGFPAVFDSMRMQEFYAVVVDSRKVTVFSCDQGGWIQLTHERGIALLQSEREVHHTAVIDLAKRRVAVTERLAQQLARHLPPDIKVTVVKEGQLQKALQVIALLMEPQPEKQVSVATPLKLSVPVTVVKRVAVAPKAISPVAAFQCVLRVVLLYHVLGEEIEVGRSFVRSMRKVLRKHLELVRRWERDDIRTEALKKNALRWDLCLAVDAPR
jgi:hypothetical protein